MRKWSPAVPIIVALGVSAALYTRLPPDVLAAVHARLPMLAAGRESPMPPVVAALLVPGMAALVWALLAWGARLRAPQPPFPAWLVSEMTDANAVARFTSTYHTITFALVAGLVLLHIAFLGLATGWPTWAFQLLTAILGTLMLVGGNVVPRVRPNWIVGIRTKGTLASAEVWTRTHRYLGTFTMVVGALVIAVSAVSVWWALVVAIAGNLVALPAAHILGMRRGRGGPPVVALAIVGVAIARGLAGGVAHAQATPPAPTPTPTPTPVQAAVQSTTSTAAATPAEPGGAHVA